MRQHKDQLTDWETQAGTLEDDARKTAEEWEAKVVEEKRRARDVQFDLEKSQTKMKGMELELTELRNSCAKIDEYEQVLGKLTWGSCCVEEYCQMRGPYCLCTHQSTVHSVDTTQQNIARFV